MVRIVDTMQTNATSTPMAMPVWTAGGRMGQEVKRPTLFSAAPEEAFGDYRGQMAIAEAVSNVGNTVMSIAARDVASKRAKEDAQLEEDTSELLLESERIANALEQEQLDVVNPDGTSGVRFRDSKEKEDEYIKRTEEAKARILGRRQYETIDGSAIEKKYDRLVAGKTEQYKAGQIQKDRILEARGAVQNTAANLRDGAVLDAQSGNLAKAAEKLTALNALFASPGAMVVFGGRDGAEAAGNDAVLKAAGAVLAEAIEKDPSKAMQFTDQLASLVGEENIKVLRESAQDAALEREREIRMADEQVFEQRYGDLALGIQDVRPSTKKRTTRLDIITARIPDAKKASLLNQLDVENRSRQKQAEEKNEVQITLENGGSLFSDPEAQRKVDNWSIKRWDELKDNPMRQQVIMQEVIQLGVVPSMFKNIVEGQLYSANDEQAVQAAATIIQLKEANPNLTFSDNAEYMSLLVTSGTAPVEAKKRVNELQTVTPEKRKELLADLDTKTETIVELLEDIDIETDNVTAVADFRQMYQKNYVRMKNKDLALKQTKLDMQRKWGDTKVGSRSGAMEYAPERAYNGEWVREDFNDEMKAKGYKPKELFIEYDQSSPRGAPRYFVMKLNDAGLPESISADPAYRWVPDIKRFQKRKAARLEKLEKVRQEAAWKEVTEGYGD